MKAEFLKPANLDDIPTMQQHLISEASRKQWACIEAGLDRYLGRKVTEADAPDIELHEANYAFGSTKVFHKGILIGALTGGWDHDFENNIFKCTWTWTPNAELYEGMCRMNEQREHQGTPIFKSCAQYAAWRESDIEYDN